MQYQHLVCFVCVLLVFGVIKPSQAEELANSIRLLGAVTPFVGGDAGTGEGAPGYSDAFGTGSGGAIEYHRHISWRVNGIIGLGYDKFVGNSYQSIDFSNQKVTTMYGGIKVDMLPYPAEWQPYARIDLGAAKFSSVTVSTQNLSGTYWDSSLGLVIDAGIGVEKHFDNWSSFGELLIRRWDTPESALGTVADADAAWTALIRLGIGWHF